MKHDWNNHRAIMDGMAKQRRSLFAVAAVWFSIVAALSMGFVGFLIWLIYYILNSPTVQKLLGYN